MTTFTVRVLKQPVAVTVQFCQCKWPLHSLVSHCVLIRALISKLIITVCLKDTHTHMHTQMAMTSVILSDRGCVRAEQCRAVSSGFFPGLILADCGDVTQQGPSKSMTHYYRRSNHSVPSPSLIWTYSILSSVEKELRGTLDIMQASVSRQIREIKSGQIYIWSTLNSLITEQTHRKREGGREEGRGLLFWINKESSYHYQQGYSFCVPAELHAGWFFFFQVKDKVGENSTKTLT